MDGNEKLYDLVGRSNHGALECKDPSLTVQSDMIDADINTIVRRFGITGSLPQSLRLPEFADYEGIFDFQSAQQVLIDARSQFMSVPADIRARFSNDPNEFLRFCSTPENVEELVRLGLAVARPAVPEPVKEPATLNT